jgi:hypothetical protein
MAVDVGIRAVGGLATSVFALYLLDEQIRRGTRRLLLR